MKKRCFLFITVGVILGIVLMSFFSGEGTNLTADKLVEHAEEHCSKITAEELEALMMSDEIYTIIDVRQASEHYYGYIPGSVLLPRGSLEFRIDNEEFWETEGLYMPEKAETIIMYCKKGSRGVLAAHTLLLMGYSNVKYLEGGWKKWELTFPDLVEKNLDALGGNTHKEESSGGC